MRKIFTPCKVGIILKYSNWSFDYYYSETSLKRTSPGPGESVRCEEMSAMKRLGLFLKRNDVLILKGLGYPH